MKIHRFIDQNFNLDQPRLVVTNPEIINQWKNVLRLTVGEKLILGDGGGYEATATLLKLTPDEAEVEIGEKVLNKNEPALNHSVGQAKQVTLYGAILKKENFELVVQKAVEVGVAKIVPITTDRTVKQNLNFERLAKIAKEAAEQSGRGVIPAIEPIAEFKAATAMAVAAGATFLFDLSGPVLSKTYALKPSICSIFIGPEGGFTESEVALAKQAGATIASLGPLTLRGETAAIIASYLAVNGL